MLKKITTGIAAFIPVIYTLLLAYYSTRQVSKIYDMAEKSGLPQEPTFPIWIPFLGMLLYLGTLGIFITDVFNNNKIEKDIKVVWVIILFVGNLVAIPIYWYLYIWKTGKHK